MATCPRCRQYLGENHRCARAPRIRRRVLLVASGFAGAVMGWVVGAAAGPPYDIFLLAIGGLTGVALAPRRRR